MTLGPTFVVGVFLALFTRHMLVMAILSALALVLTGNFGARLGLPQLFWHRRAGTQAVAGAAVGALLAELVLVGYLRDRDALSKTDVTGVHYFQGCAATLAACFGVFWLCGRALCRFAPRPPRREPRWPFFAGTASMTLCLLVAVRAAARWTPEESLGRALGALPGFAVLPAGDRALHLGALLVFLATLGAWLGCVVDRHRRWTTAAMALCSLVGLVAMAHGFIAARVETASLVVGVALVLLALGGLPAAKLRVAALTADYGSGPRLRLELAPSLAAAPVPWRRHGARRPLVLVSASGDGIGAAVWTAAVLAGLEQRIPGFPWHCRFVAGSSGGMLGASWYVGSLLPSDSSEGWAHRVAPERFAGSLVADALSALAHRVATWDLPLAFLPLATGTHRGAAFDEHWRATLGSALSGRLSDGERAERAGRRPSLVYAAQVVEDGSRILVTNHPLAAGADGLSDRLRQLPLSTLVMLSASGGFMLPACALPTARRRRIVRPDADAGALCALGSWLDGCLRSPEAHAWLRHEVSGVLLLELRPRGGAHEKHALLRGFEELTGPAEAARAGDGPAADAFLGGLTAAFGDRFGADYVRRLCCTFDAAPGWDLASAESAARSAAALESQGAQVVEQVAAWWAERPSSDNVSAARAWP